MEFVNDEAASLNIEVEDDIMSRLVEVVIVDSLWLVQEHGFAIGIDLSENSLFL